MDLPSQIARYQNTLKYARSKVDFVYGIGLYMSPSNMELRIGTIQDYNNEIVIVTDAQDLGLNDGVNTKSIPPNKLTMFKEHLLEHLHNKTSSQGIAQMFAQIAVSHLAHVQAVSQVPTQVQATQKQEKAVHEEHKNNKTALIFGAIVLGTALTLFKC